jgi:hypothetical protein
MMRYLLATLSFVLSWQASRAAEEVCMIRAASHSEALSGHPGQLTSDVILRTIAGSCRAGQVVTIFGPREMIMEADGFCDFSKQIVVSKDGDRMSCVFGGLRRRGEIHDVSS